MNMESVGGIVLGVFVVFVVYRIIKSRRDGGSGSGGGGSGSKPPVHRK